MGLSETGRTTRRDAPSGLWGLAPGGRDAGASSRGRSNSFQSALPACEKTTSPRTWALALIGIHEYLRRLSGDRLADQMRDTLTEKLIDLYERTASDDWPWFEDVASYANATLSHALILSGRWSGNADALQIGLHSLRWLAAQQLSPEGRFRPIGCNGFCRRDKPIAAYDQQPIESPRNDLRGNRGVQRGGRFLLDRSRPTSPSTGSFVEMTSVNRSTTLAPVAVTTASRRAVSTRTRAPNRPWHS